MTLLFDVICRFFETNQYLTTLSRKEAYVI